MTETTHIHAPVDETHTTGLSLTSQQIADFQELYEREYGVVLTADQALDKGLRLVRLLRATLQATAKKELQDKHENV